MRSISRLFLNEIGFFLILSLLFIFTPSQRVSTSVGRIESPAYPVALAATSPRLNFSTFLGGNSWDVGYGIAVASDGSCYVTGVTTSSDFPTLNAYNNTKGGNPDAFVSKFSSNGSLLWSTFLGGNADEYGVSIAVASDGSCYVTGGTESANFPTLNAYNSTYGGADAFLTKFSTNGTLLWSTFLGGSSTDGGFSIAVTHDDSCYVTGDTHSSNFPTKNAFDSSYNGGECDAFISKFSVNGSLLWSTYLGGMMRDCGHGIATSSDGSCYITGETRSYNFPTLNAYSNTKSGYSDAFVAKFSQSGSLIWSTYLGGNDNDDYGYRIATASDGCCNIVGITSSTDFPTLKAFNSTYAGGVNDVFVARFSSGGSLLWSTYLGGNSYDEGYGIAVAGDGSCYVAGGTWSSNFPLKNAYDSTFDNCDAFLARFSARGSLLWSTYFGGYEYDYGYALTVTSDGSCYVTGETVSNDFPTKNAYDSSLGDGDAFVSKLIDSSYKRLSASGFLCVLVVLPLIVLIIRKRRK